ncbi:hypothetical protein G6F32_014989 [Rhizopus arrhizus]|nr:hypothetical protein G6F32_014989 [Rhizopus arrhizus]
MPPPVFAANESWSYTRAMTGATGSRSHGSLSSMPPIRVCALLPGVDQGAALGCLRHDFGIATDVGRRRRSAGQLDQVGAVADQFQLAARFEPFADGDGVCLAALLQHVLDGLPDQLVVTAACGRSISPPSTACSASMACGNIRSLSSR